MQCCYYGIVIAGRSDWRRTEADDLGKIDIKKSGSERSGSGKKDVDEDNEVLDKTTDNKLLINKTHLFFKYIFLLFLYFFFFLRF